MYSGRNGHLFRCSRALFLFDYIFFLKHVNGIVQSPPYFIKQPPSDELLFQVAENQPFLIECEAEGEPQPKYNWIKNGKNFNWRQYGDRIRQHPGRGTLIFTEPKDEDIGQYQCFSKNEWGIATSNSVFVKKAELNSFIDEDPKTQLAEEGKPYKLLCNPPDGFPKPRVYWTLQNNLGALKSINTSRLTVDPEGNLWFSNITRFDRSTEFLYVCTVYSSFLNQYKLGNRVHLNVAPASSRNYKRQPTLQYASKDTIALKGSTASLWCIVGGTPLPEIKWSRKGGELPRGRTEFDNFGKKLVIKNVDFSDEGNYDCLATNSAGKISHSVNITVYAAPYFTVEPEIVNTGIPLYTPFYCQPVYARTYYAEGETVELVCEAMGKPLPEIQWIQDGEPLFAPNTPNSRTKFINRNKIVIEKIMIVDISNYGCNASNSFGYVYKGVYVNVLALPPEIKEGPTDAMTTEGKSVSFTCRVFGAPKPQVKWIKNDKELTGGKYSINDNGDLEIRDVTFVDAGQYTCFAWNKFGNDTVHGALIVKEHTRIIDKPEDYEVAAGTTVTFRCSAVADSTLTLIIDWLIDGVPIDFDAEQHYIKLQDNSLTIDKTIKLDSGVYTCFARTDLDMVTSNATLSVQDVPNRPQLLGIECGHKSATIRWRSMGDNSSPILYFTIEFNTSFAPDFWEVAFKDVPNSVSSYAIPMSPYANYTFRVIARNNIGPSLPSFHSDVCLSPNDVPFKNPDNVKGHGPVPNNLVISWNPMKEIDHNAPKFRYQVQWRLDGPGSPNQWEIHEVKDWRITELLIPNQPTNAPYWIRVRAINEIGESNVAPTEVKGWSGQDIPTMSSCPPLIQKKGVKLECKLPENGTISDCYKIIPEGTIASFKCAKYYTRNESPRQGEMLCSEDGVWEHFYDYEDFHCKIECGVTSPLTPVIIGGSQVSKYDFPWHATIFLRNRTTDLFDLVCGGSLIDLMDEGPLILTAAHCLVADEEDYRVILGANTSTYLENKDTDSQIFHVSYYEVYPSYNRTSLEDDIAVMKLKGDIVYSNAVKPICIERGSPFPNVRDKGITVGFGKTEYGKISKKLLVVSLPVRSRSLCEERVPADSNFTFPATKFCAGFDDQFDSDEHNEISPGICLGDSGGGLITFDTKKKLSMIVGISHAAFKTPLFSCSGLGYFQSVGKYIGWIREVQKFIDPNNETITSVCDQDVVSQNLASHWTVYNRMNASEATFSVTFRRQDSDLSFINARFDKREFRVCYRGIWLPYFEPNFLVPTHIWVNPSENCMIYLSSISSYFKSLRPVGDPDDFTRSSITFYETKDYKGLEHVFFENVPSLNGIDFKSLILTGSQPLKIFTGEDYGGTSKCIQPKQYYNLVTNVDNVEAGLGNESMDIKSIKFGCF